MRIEIRYTGRKVDGYGDCWYCNEVVVDPRVYRVTGHLDIKAITVCRKRKCREAADSDTLDYDPE